MEEYKNPKLPTGMNKNRKENQTDTEVTSKTSNLKRMEKEPTPQTQPSHSIGYVTEASGSARIMHLGRMGGMSLVLSHNMRGCAPTFFVQCPERTSKKNKEPLPPKKK